jgi:hypothetical protein
LSFAPIPYWQMVCGSWPIAAVEGRAYRQTRCGPRPEPGMRSVQQRGPGPVPGPCPDPDPDPDPGPSQRQPGVSTQRHWRPVPDPGTAQHAQRARASSSEPEAAEWLTIGALAGVAPALLLAPTPAVNRDTVTINSNLDFIRFLPQLPPQAIQAVLQLREPRS